MKASIREIETKSEDFRIKYKNGVEIQKVIEDLNGIKAENSQLEAKLKSAGLLWFISFYINISSQLFI